MTQKDSFSCEAVLLTWKASSPDRSAGSGGPHRERNIQSSGKQSGTRKARGEGVPCLGEGFDRAVRCTDGQGGPLGLE